MGSGTISWKNMTWKNAARKNKNEKRWKLCRLARIVWTGSAGFHLFLLFLNGSAHDAGDELLLEYHEDNQDRQRCDGGG